MQIPLERAVARRRAYPESLRTDHVDVLHGVPVADPYRWLEDLESERTRAWVEAQNRLTAEHLHTLPEREAIRRRLTELWNFERYGVPVCEGRRYFFTCNDGLQDQSVLYTLETLDGVPRVLIDPNALSQDGTVALTSFNVSPDGRLVAYGLAHAGSDWQEWRVRDVETGCDLADHLQWVKFSQSAWTHDNGGFFYCRYDEPVAGRPLEDAHFWQKLYYHRLGTPQSADELVYQRLDDKEMGFIPFVSDDGRYLFIHVWKGTENENAIFYRDLSSPSPPSPPSSPSPVIELLAAFDACYTYVGTDGPVVWFVADLDAPRGRLIAIDLRQPAREHWRELIPETVETLQGVSCIGGRFLAHYLKDAYSQVRIFHRDGRPLGELELPALGSVNGFFGRGEDRETFYCFTSFTVPGTIYHWDADTGESRVFRSPALSFDPEDYETRQVFYPSLDGTRVPMFITARKGTPHDGRRPTYLYGYGGFNTAMTPSFSLPLLVWMERGGVYAVANLRGGGEYGEEWHQGGSRRQKQNTFDDFIAAAQWLSANGTTAPDRLAVGGHSNGGLLAAATLIQRPDLFAAALVGVGVLDMLRFHLFTIGWGWVSDYGSPDDPGDFAVLYSYSPYHNVRLGEEYPAVLITTADHDDRVVPAHSFKFAAALQSGQAGPAPVLIRIETRAGHGSGKPTSKQIEEAADELSFLWAELVRRE
jgi:prolyl oligopeptidase